MSADPEEGAAFNIHGVQRAVYDDVFLLRRDVHQPGTWTQYGGALRVRRLVTQRCIGHNHVLTSSRGEAIVR